MSIIAKHNCRFRAIVGLLAGGPRQAPSLPYGKVRPGEWYRWWSLKTKLNQKQQANLMTLPRVVRLRLMAVPSLSRSASEPEER